jgi:tetratricopeptide (TPR) repeat protein
LRRAEYYQSVGAEADAEAAYQQARQLGPQSMGGYEQRMGIFLAEQGRLEEAKPFFEEAVNRDPQDTTVMQNAQRFQQQVAQKHAYDTRASQEWKASIWPVEHGILQGKVPPDWVATPNEAGVRLAPQAGGVTVDVTIVPIASETEMNEWLIKTQSSFGLLLDSGRAELPGVEMAMIRLWQNQEKVQIHEFIIPYPDGLVRIVVIPGESQLQKTVNELLTVFVPQFEPK